MVAAGQSIWCHCWASALATRPVWGRIVCRPRGVGVLGHYVSSQVFNDGALAAVCRPAQIPVLTAMLSSQRLGLQCLGL